MATGTGSVSGDLISKLNAEAEKSTTKKKDDKSIGKDEFLKMLVAQLKTQDPMNPMDGDQFAVNLAQFSQLERLVSIDNKLGGDSAGADSASLASYLGHEVTLNTQKVTVEAGEGGILRTKVPFDGAELEADLIDAKGKIVDTIDLGVHNKGEKSIELSGLTVPSGEYSFELRAKGAGGSSGKLLAQVGGLVSGFVPGADPKLLIGGREVAPADVKAVLAQSQL